MYVLTPKTMTALVFAGIALIFGGILAGFGFALLTERSDQRVVATPARGSVGSPATSAPTAIAAPTPIAAPTAIAAPTPIAAPTAIAAPTPVPLASVSLAPPAVPPPAVPNREAERSAVSLQAPPSDRAVVGVDASVTLETAQVDRRAGGIEILIRVDNLGDRTLSFPFSPGHNLVVTDDRGHVYSVRWAEYDGQVRLTAGQQTRLVRAFFAGPIDHPDIQRIEVRARDLPGIGRAAWEVEVAP